MSNGGVCFTMVLCHYLTNAPQIQSLHKDDYIELLQYMATQYGEMKFLYTCDQCYDNVYEWTLSTD